MRALFTFLFLAMLPAPVAAQGWLVLSGGYGAPAQTTNLNLRFSAPPGVAVAALQWTLTFPANSVSALVVTAGPVATGSQKTPVCAAGGSGTYTCILSGPNATAIQNGVVAVVGVTLAPSASVSVALGIMNALGASTDPNPASVPLSTAGGSVFIPEFDPSSITTVQTGALVLAEPQSVVVDASGNLLIADTLNHRIVRVTPTGAATVVAGLGSPAYSGDGGPATNAQLNEPAAVALDSSGNVYVADSQNHRVRRFSVGGDITTIAGTGVPGYSGDGGPAAAAQLNQPLGVAVDSSGNVYIADTNNNRIRMIAPGGTMSTLAGTGPASFTGDSGPATSATLAFPAGVAVDSSGNIYASDSGNRRVRKLTAGGNILTVAGGGCCGVSGDGGPGTAAQLVRPIGVTTDPAGNLYLADAGDNRIRMVSAGTGTIATAAGTGVPGSGPNQLNGPSGVASDALGNLHIADSNNNRIQQVIFYQGSIGLGSSSGAPGGTIQIPLTLNLNRGAAVDSLGASVQISSAAGGPVIFTPAAGISSPSLNAPAAGSLALAWSHNLSSAAQPTVSGSVVLGTVAVPVPAAAPIGSLIEVSVARVAGDLTAADGTLTPVPLQAGPPGYLLVQNCTYLVGDTYPLSDPTTDYDCGEFGDDQITFEDVIVALRVWGGVPGFVVPACTDLSDALDASPPDAPGVLGGDGLPMDLQDVQVIVNRWANLDSTRPTRPAGSYLRFPSCSVAPGSPKDSPLISRRMGRPRTPAPAPVGGAIELGAAETAGGGMRVPVYLRASQPLTALGLSIGWADPGAAPLRFDSGPLAKPVFVDTDVPGMVTAAWLQSLPQNAGQPLLLGYLVWNPVPGAAPARMQVRRAEAASDNHTLLRLDVHDAAQ